MNILKLEQLQRLYGVTEIQNHINSGLAWKLEGSVGRFAMSMLEAGVCMLPLVPRIDYYGNRVPARTDLKKGTKGTYQNCARFWEKVQDNEFEVIEWLEANFCTETN